jgi:tetratricopeptide (TPR) repeat protein
MTLAAEFNNTGMALISQAAFDGDRLRPLHYTSRTAIELEAGRFHSAISYAAKGQAEARKIGTVLDELQCAVYEAQAFVYLGNLPTALQILQAARELAVSSGLEGSDRDLGILDVTAEVLLDKSQYVEAYKLYRCISQQTSPVRAPRYHIYATLALIEMETLVCFNSPPGTAEKITHLRERSKYLDWTHGLLLSDILTADLLLSTSRSSIGPTLHIKCFEAARNTDNIQVMLKCLSRLGDSNSWPLNSMGSFNWAVTYLALAQKSKHLSHTYQSLLFLGDMLLDEGDKNAALSLFRTVLEGSKEMGVLKREANCLSRIGKILNSMGNRSDAEVYWESAHQVYSDSSVRDGIGKISVS